MKLRKILCLSLAAAVTFTSTVSSTSSAAVASEVTNQNQCFGCIILDKMKNDMSDSNENPGISPLWTGDTHDEIILGGDNNYIPAAYSDLVYKICKWCDDKSKIPFATCLHGNRNYVASLKFLWTYAQKISVNSGEAYNVQSEKAKTECLTMFSKEKFDNLNPADKKDYVELVKLADTTEYVINTYGKFKNGEGRKYLIIGLIMHLLGDVTAHRTVVPKKMVTNAGSTFNKNNQSRFVISDFTTAGWNTIKSEVNNANLDFTHIQYYFSEDFTGNKLTRYEDNPDCIPNRVLSSESMIDYFLHYFNYGFMDSIFDIPYDDVNLIYLNSKYKRQI